MRRMSGRSPPFLPIGLSFICLMLAYNCWTFSSENGDLRKETEKLQTQIKLSGIKQDQSEKKVQILQEDVHNFESKANLLQQQVSDYENTLKDAQNNVKVKDFEITKLKDELTKFKENERDLKQLLEDKEAKIEIMQKEAQHILSLKNDGDDVLAEKDALINKLMRQIEQLKSELSANHKEGSQPTRNIPHDQNIEPYLDHGELKAIQRSDIRDTSTGMSGFIVHPGLPILPRQPSKTQRARPRFSVADIAAEMKLKEGEKEHSKLVIVTDKNIKENAIIQPEHNSISKDPLVIDVPADKSVVEKPNMKQEVQQSKPILPPIFHSLNVKDADVNPVLNIPKDPDIHLPNADPADPVIHQPDLLQKEEKPSGGSDRANVIPPPLQHPDENPDVAIDEDEKILDDPSDDQDEEGKEIKRDLENNAEDNYNYDADPDGNQALLFPNRKIGGSNLAAPAGGGGRSELRGIGAKMEILPKDDIDAGGEIEREEANMIDQEHDQRAHDRVYDTNLENKIRNLGRI